MSRSPTPDRPPRPSLRNEGSMTHNPNHDIDELDTAELTSQIEMGQFTIDQLTMRAQRLDAELTSARRRRVGVHTAAVAVPMTIGTIALAAGHALDTIGFAQAIFIIAIAISTISTGVIAAAGIYDNEIGRIAENLADTREKIDKAAMKRHAMMQKMITRPNLAAFHPLPEGDDSDD